MGKMKHIPLLLLAAVLAVGCSQDDLANPDQGRQPLVIQAEGLGVTEAGITRATVDGDWKDASSVGILIGNEVKEYSVTPNADNPTTATLSAAQGVEPFYWGNNIGIVKAWYPYSAEFPTTVAVAADQSDPEKFAGSDRLLAEGTPTEENNTLFFSHRVAKVTFKFTSNSMDLSTMESVSVVGVTGVDGGGNSVLAYQPDAANHTYQVLLAPQMLAAGKTALTLKVNGFDYAWVPDQNYALEANYNYTFDLTISNFDPNIKFNGCTITDWKDGGSYDENVPIPDSRVKIYVNLAELTEEYVINDDEYYVFSGSGSYGIKVTGGIPDICLENAQISVSSGNAIDITGGNPTIHVQGENNEVTSNDGAGIFVAENYTVTITGNSREDKLKANGGNGSTGIGGYITGRHSGENCGNIEITNVHIEAHGSEGQDNYSPAIGGAGGQSCGTITIDAATVYAYGVTWYPELSSSAIGSGSNSKSVYGSFGIITIRNGSEVYVHRGNELSDYIGYSGELYRPATAPDGIIATVDETSKVIKLN